MKQIKKLNKVQIGPRLVKCPTCGRMSARIDSVVTSSGKLHRRIVCYNSSCRAEKVG